MSNVYQLQTSEQREDEASLWIARLDRELTEQEREELQSWMARDPRNEQVLLQMAELWDKADALSKLASVFPHAPETKRSAMSWRLPAVAVAASLTLAVFVSWWGLVGVNPGMRTDMASSGQAVYETAIGDHSTIELSDGSLLDLNTNSLVRVSYTTHARLIYLERGELNIEVEPDPDRPLSVVAGDRVIQAVGTAFNVKLNSSQEIELVVSHGKVMVGVRPERTGDSGLSQPQLLAEVDKADGLLVEKGGYVVLDGDEPELQTLDTEEIEVRLSWADGNLIFRGEPLSDIVAEISRYTPIEFVFLDENIKRIRVAGLFKAGDVSGFLAALQANFNIVYEQVDDEHILLKTRADAE